MPDEQNERTDHDEAQRADEQHAEKPATRSLSPSCSRPCRNKRALRIASSAWRFSSTAMRSANACHMYSVKQPRDADEHGDDRRRRTRAGEPNAEPDEIARAGEQRERCRSSISDEEQRDAKQHAPVRPAFAKAFAHRHRAVAARALHALDQRTRAQELQDDERDDDGDDDERDDAAPCPRSGGVASGGSRRSASAAADVVLRRRDRPGNRTATTTCACGRSAALL